MYTLLLLNGGIGARIGADRPKQLLNIKGLPILVYSLAAVDSIAEISHIMVNYPPEWEEEIERVVEDYAVQTPVTFVPAGRSRHESVALMLEQVSTDHVIIHESARPLVRKHDFEALIAAERTNVSFMSSIPFTVAPVDPKESSVIGSLDRSRLRNVQLPQKYLTTDLRAGHDFARREGLEFTEDATLVVTAGGAVHYIDGQDYNIKVTTPTDVKLATYLLREENPDNV